MISPKIEVREKKVTEVQERVVTRTVIKERPDGTKETIIISKTDKDTREQLDREESPADNQWIAGVTYRLDERDVYGVQISRRIIGDFYLGGYVSTDKEFGAIVSYSF